jgi:hypothetical protein
VSYLARTQVEIYLFQKLGAATTTNQKEDFARLMCAVLGRLREVEQFLIQVKH